MKIFAGHDGSGCGYYRMQMPLEELNKHDGYEVTFRSAGDQDGPNTVTLADMQGYDVIVGQRFNKHDGLGVWRRARTPTSRLVYETDDDVFSINMENWNAYRLFTRSDIQDAVIHGAEIADLITVTTEPLAGVMREYNPNVAVLPNCVPGWACDMQRAQRDRPSVGWQGGASHGADVGLITKPVRQFLKRFPGWDLRLAGTDYRPSFKVPRERAIFSNWVQVNQDPAKYYATMDFSVGLAPLLDNTFNKSKSAIKALEYMSQGIPVIASDVAVYQGVVQHGYNGFLVRYDHEWLKYMSELAAEPKLLVQMSEAARNTARQHTIETGYTAWRDAYEGLFKR
jgi:glycosyl transferase family 1